MKRIFIVVALMVSGIIAGANGYPADGVRSVISIKSPGNDAVRYELKLQEATNPSYDYDLVTEKNIPVVGFQKITEAQTSTTITVYLTATEDVYFNYSQLLPTGYIHENSLFYMPGFWYRKNLRSPKRAPSFHTSDSWTVREDRLSTPLTAIFNEETGTAISVLRKDSHECDALATHKEGEIILSGKTSIGYTGFENVDGKAFLSFGFPYKETPKTYLRKLTLAPSVEAYQKLSAGETITLTWEVRKIEAKTFADCVSKTWEYSYDSMKPQPVDTPYTAERMKEVLSNFFVESYVDSKPVKYYSGVELLTNTCESTGVAEVGFVGRTLLNAFNALEYGELTSRHDLVDNARSIFDSYLENGFSAAGFFNEVDHYHREGWSQGFHSIRRQSEGIYAVLYYLDYEKKHGRKHIEWETAIRRMLDSFMKIQNPDGSFPRKFKDDLSLVDASGGSTPSATLPLVMAYKYFKDKRYLESAKQSVRYLENEIISKSDYFSSTLDANCEDKEASLYASTAAYYLALVCKGEERSHYLDLSRQAAYFALSWYYTWDVPFAPGQMLGDIGLKSRGWGNVSVENNHIDVFIFDFADVLHYLANEYGESRFSEFSDVISTSMRQLLPYEGHLCGIAKTGYYPEVVQHTNWDYGRNGKGYYNNLFAPGWTVASLWELLSPGRAERFLNSK